MSTVHKHTFTFNDLDNGGEAVTLTTTWKDTGDPGGYATQELSLQSYGRAVTLRFGGYDLSPIKLRQLADELESASAVALAKTLGIPHVNAN